MGTGLPLLIIDVTNSCRDPANSGVVRVTRQLSRQIQQRLDPLFVVWDFDRQEYVLPSPAGYRYLQQFNGPQMPMIAQDCLQAGMPPTLDQFLAQQLELADRPRVFLFAETILDARCQAALDYVQQRGWESAAILYDLIPMLYPEYCSNGVKSFFEIYLKLVAAVDDAIGISEFSAQCFRDYCDKNDLTPGNVSAIMLPGEFGKHQRHTKSNPDSDCLKLLCVSTLEPRKNHRSLIEACAILSQQYPEVKWELTLVGNSYTGAPEIKQAIEDLAAQDSRVQWLGIVDDAQLHQLYHEAHITVYSSLVEGFGMPILESIWHGRPCLCHHAGVMAELAAQTPGCVALDMTNPAAIATQIVHLAQNPETIANLTEAACHASLKTWNNYVDEIFHLLDLKELPAMNNALTQPRNTWQEILYPICNLSKWQMNDSERMALTGLLARHQPSCSIEIGTYYGGSLALIAEHSEMVFSIDIDPEVGSRFPKPDNVSLFTGPSTVVFPQLIETLTAAGVAVDFILIDGDHSSEGVRRDVNLVLSYVPKTTTLVVMHDSFNPSCRQGMLAADWASCPHVLWVDIDFVPGRVIEPIDGNPFSGEMWGGLGLAILSPEPRSEDLAVWQSARTFFDLALNTRS
jgi:glycosyltransferase involved in cell wall biosynthesis